MKPDNSLDFKADFKVAAIVAEFNPFHSGHKYLIDETRRKLDVDYIVAIMSGNFVQRGQPAVFDKWKRAEAAVKNGVNLVIQLPEIFSSSSAQFFAKGSVDILEEMGIVRYIAFGSESGNIERLNEIVCIESNNKEALDSRIKELTINEGISYPKAREISLSEIIDFDLGELISSPNNILALEYMRNLKRIKPCTIKRFGEGYHESSSKIRNLLYADPELKLKERDKVRFDLIRSRLLLMKTYELDEFDREGNGLILKLLKNIRNVKSLEELIMETKSKRYTYTRIERLISQIMLGIVDDDILNGARYIRPLAFDDKGAQLIKYMKKNDVCSIPFVKKIDRNISDNILIRGTLSKDVLATDLYNIICNKNLYENSDYVRKPVYVK